MEIEKVIHIVAVFIAILSFGVWVVTMIFFPATGYARCIPPLIILAGCLRLVWHKRCPKTTKDE